MNATGIANQQLGKIQRLVEGFLCTGNSRFERIFSCNPSDNDPATIMAMTANSDIAWNRKSLPTQSSIYPKLNRSEPFREERRRLADVPPAGLANYFSQTLGMFLRGLSLRVARRRRLFVLELLLLLSMTLL